ncbi:MAG: dipeptidyl-peptidase-4, partial [Algoriphagus sp.]
MKQILTAILLLFLFQDSFAQEKTYKGNYELAARYSPEQVKKMIFSTSVNPHWLKKSDRFWYEYETSDGKNWILIDPVRNTKSQLFERDKLAMEISKITKDAYDGQHLKIEDVKFLEDDNAIRFKVEGTEKVLKSDWAEIKAKDKSAKDSMENRTFVFRYSIGDQALKEIVDAPKDPKRMSWADIAPDSSRIVFAKQFNLYWMDKANFLKAVKDEKDSTIVEYQLTTNGEKDYEYGYGGRGDDNEEEVKNKDKRKRAGVLWSTDSKQFILTRTDARTVKDLWVIHNTRNPRPTLETYKYAMPGEKEQPRTDLMHYSFETEKLSNLPISTFKDQTVSLWSTTPKANTRDDDFRPATWLGDLNEFYFAISSRDLKKVDVYRWNISRNERELVIEERSNTYIDFEKIELVNGGNELIWWSQRDGWGHFYLYGKDGAMKRQLTSGAFHVAGAVRVDDKNRRLFFAANGKERGEDPYYEHLYSVSLDGGVISLLNAGNFNFDMEMNDNANYFVTNYSRVNTSPVSVLMDRSGAKIMDLETTDLRQLMASGYQFPEPFKFKADDGITD